MFKNTNILHPFFESSNTILHFNIYTGMLLEILEAIKEIIIN